MEAFCMSRIGMLNIMDSTNLVYSDISIYPCVCFFHHAQNSDVGGAEHVPNRLAMLGEPVLILRTCAPHATNHQHCWRHGAQRRAAWVTECKKRPRTCNCWQHEEGSKQLRANSDRATACSDLVMRSPKDISKVVFARETRGNPEGALRTSSREIFSEQISKWDAGQKPAVVWCGVVWCGVVCCGVVCCGVLCRLRRWVAGWV